MRGSPHPGPLPDWRGSFPTTCQGTPRMRPVTNPNLLRHYRTVVVLFGALATSMLLMALLVAVLPARDGLPVGGDLGFVQGSALIVFVVLYFVIRGLRNRRLFGEGLPAMVDQVLIPGQRYRRMVGAVAVTFAYSEAVVFVGLFFYLFTGDKSDFYVFAAIGAAFLLMSFPSYTRWEQWFAHRTLVR